MNLPRWRDLDTVQKTAAVTMGALGFGALWWYLGQTGEAPAPAGVTGTYRQLWNTYYSTEFEDNYSGPATSGLYQPNGALIANVPLSFARSLFVEGAGFLRDGRLVNFSSPCSYGDYFQINAQIHGRSCYRVIDRDRTPWGQGAGGRALVPLRTIAVDRFVIPIGSQVYIRQYDGLDIPLIATAAGALGGFRHDGRFVAGDTGGAIHDNHIDVFSGSRSMARVLERLVPTRSRLDAWIA